MNQPLLLTIDGRAVDTPRHLDVIDPATGAAFTQVPDADGDILDQAVNAAQRAFTAWAAQPLTARREQVLAFVDAVAAEAQALAPLLTREQGKPLAKAASEIQAACTFARAFAAFDLAPRVLRETPTQRVELHRHPLGVVGAITAWNYPVLLALWKIAPALLAGNTLVLKPSPYTPLTTLRLGELARQHLPAGVLNVLSGGDALGQRLVAHPGVRKISFTGSVSTGRQIMATAAGNLKRLTLELGGNDAGIVLDDADPAAIAHDLFWAKFSNCGQVCAALKRLYVPRRLQGAVCEALAAVAEKVAVGPGLQAGVDIGPIQNRAQFERVRSCVDEALAQGASVAYRGQAPQGPGYFHPVTLITDVQPSMRLWREELFGPVLGIMPYDDEAAALAAANDSEYGLGGSVWSPDTERAARLAAQLASGNAWVNQHPAMGPDLPFGGHKQSGLGVELGEAGLHEYTALQVLNIKRDG